MNFFRSISVGYRFLDLMRAKTEFLYESGEGSNIEANIYRLTGTAYIDIPTGSSIRPYAGAGLGLAYDNKGVLLNGEQFTFHGGGGINVAITDNIGLAPGARVE
ncbi:MAG: outer membrane beta-barrel protein [Geminicoccaceae bacterium]